MSFLSGLTKGFASLAIPPPAGSQASLAQAYNPDAYDEEVLLKQIADEINAMPIPPEWKKYYLANFKSQLAIEQAARPSVIASRAREGIVAYPITLKSILLTLRHPCFKARIRNMLKSEEEKLQSLLRNEAPPEVIEANKEASMKMFLVEIIGGYANHSDYDLDKNGLPIGARNSRAAVYSQPPPVGCNMPKSPKYAGSKRKTKKRKHNKRKTKKRVLKKYA